MVETVREIGIHPGAKIERETRFYIASAAPSAEVLGTDIRSHWSIENGLLWVMDMDFRDDECRIRKKNAPANFTTVKHMASNLLRRAPGTDSLRLSAASPHGMKTSYKASFADDTIHPIPLVRPARESHLEL